MKTNVPKSHMNQLETRYLPERKQTHQYWIHQAAINSILKMAFDQKLEISVSSANILPQDAFFPDYEGFEEENFDSLEYGSQYAQDSSLVLKFTLLDYSDPETLLFQINRTQGIRFGNLKNTRLQIEYYANNSNGELALTDAFVTNFDSYFDFEVNGSNLTGKIKRIFANNTVRFIQNAERPTHNLQEMVKDPTHEAHNIYVQSLFDFITAGVNE